MKEAKVKYEELTAYTKRILEKLGYPKAQADVTAWALVEADARGVNSHGVGRLEFYESNIKNGFNFPAAEPEIVHETPLSVVVDGHNGVGAYVAQFAMNRALEKARNAGAGFAAVRNSNHFGMAALWGEMATAEGFIGMSFCNTRICSIVTFGKDRILGTNPMCFAIPSSGKVPFVLDMATTTVAHGKIEVYERLNKTMPIGWVVDENGADTTGCPCLPEDLPREEDGRTPVSRRRAPRIWAAIKDTDSACLWTCCAPACRWAPGAAIPSSKTAARESRSFSESCAPIFSGNPRKLRRMSKRS